MPDLIYVFEWIWSYLLPFLAPSIAVYLYLKTRNSKIDSAKRETVRTLLHQIGAEGKITLFQIESVCNAKLRERKVGKKNIPNEIIIEDLVSEILSNPLIENDKKSMYIDNLEIIRNGVHKYQSNYHGILDSDGEDFIDDPEVYLAPTQSGINLTNYSKNFIITGLIFLVIYVVLEYLHVLNIYKYDYLNLWILGVLTAIISVMLSSRNKN